MHNKSVKIKKHSRKYKLIHYTIYQYPFQIYQAHKTHCNGLKNDKRKEIKVT
jgi:hypothetical protein